MNELIILIKNQIKFKKMGNGKKFLRIATIVSGVLLFALAVARLIKILDLTFSQTLLTFYMM